MRLHSVPTCCRAIGERARSLSDVLIRKQFSFEAAHVLPFHAGKCARPHGHSYRLDVTVSGPLQREGPGSGMVIDFDDLGEIVRSEILDVLDHRSLNDIIANPTAERIAAWIWARLAPHVTNLRELALWETANACAILRADDPHLADHTADAATR